MEAEKVTNAVNVIVNPNISYSTSTLKFVGHQVIFRTSWRFSSKLTVVCGSVKTVGSKSSDRDTLLDDDDDDDADNLDKMKKMASTKQSQDKRKERKQAIFIPFAGTFILVAISVAVIVIIFVYRENSESNATRKSTTSAISITSKTSQLEDLVDSCLKCNLTSSHFTPPVVCMGGRSDSGDEECEEDKRKACALHYWCWWWLKVVGSNKNNYYANAIMTASYQVLADFRVIKYVYVIGPVPGGGFWHRTDVGQYVYFPSETRWLFVNRISIEADDAVDPQCSLTSSSSTIVLRYCAHRSHTPTENFAEVLHREPIRENWPKLLAVLKELQKRQIQKHACVTAVGVTSTSTFPMNIGVGSGATSLACRKRPYVQSSVATAVVE